MSSRSTRAGRDAEWGLGQAAVFGEPSIRDLMLIMVEGREAFILGRVVERVGR
jgi:hypothetical protein